MVDVHRELGHVENVLKRSEQPGLALMDEAVHETGHGINGKQWEKEEGVVSGLQQSRRKSQKAQRAGKGSGNWYSFIYSTVHWVLCCRYRQLINELLSITQKLRNFDTTLLKMENVRVGYYSVFVLFVVMYEWAI